MKIAVIKSGGKQYLIRENDKIRIDPPATLRVARRAGKVDAKNKLVFDDILFGKKVEAKVLRQGRYKKVIAFKYKPKKRYRKKKGHRQEFTEIEITKIYD